MVAPSIDLSAFDVLTFDCYGTLIDWESGLLAAARPVLDAHGVMDIGDDALLEAYARHEAELEAGEYLTYREVLAGALRGVGADLGFEPSDDEVAMFSGSVGDWPPFPDSSEALHRLHQRFRLAPITNCDDDLFAASAKRLGVDFDWVITAQQARSYKPSAEQLRARLRANRRSAGAHPARGAEPLPRPRDGQAPGHDHGLGGSPARARRLGRHPAGRGPARSHRAGHAHARGPRRGLSAYSSQASARMISAIPRPTPVMLSGTLWLRQKSGRARDAS